MKSGMTINGRKPFEPFQAPLRNELHRRALKAILRGRYAHLGGRTIAQRAQNVAKIARAYTREELLAEPGIGNSTAIEIELWLEARGLYLRTIEVD